MVNVVLLAGGRPSKFLYSGKNSKTDPWSTNNEDHEDGIELALQPKNKLLKTHNKPGMRDLYI